MRFLFHILLIATFALPVQAQSSESGPLEGGGLLQQSAVLADYAQFESGELLFAAGSYEAAIPAYFGVVKNYTDSLLHPRAWLMIGKSQFNLKNFSRASKTFRHLIKKHPESREVAEARYLIALALEKQKLWKDAYLAYEEVDLHHPLSQFGRKARLAIKELKRAHKKRLPRFKASAAALFKNGMDYFEDDDFHMAANIFARLAREYPKSKYIKEAWLMLGRAEMQTNSTSAIANLERAARFDGRAHYYLGLAHGRRGKFERAILELKKVTDHFPDSGLADDAAYWIAYYQEINGGTTEALKSYYDLIKNYPFSKSVPAAIWRLGRIYYWAGDFKNAAVYLHLAQIYPPGEDSPRCYFFEAKALERLGNRASALEVYQKLIARFDHTYYAYRAQEKLGGNAPPGGFSGEEFGDVLDNLKDGDQEKLEAVMEIWEEANTEALSTEEARVHLAKYKELMALGLIDYAAGEARFLVNATSDAEKESAQAKLGEMLINSGNYRTPIRFADRRVRAAVLAGKPNSVTKKIWQFAYPRGYWKHVSDRADEFGLDPYLVLAVIREESRFNPRAISRSNARGLMQIIPRTGRGIAKNLKLSGYRTRRLYEVPLNIKMGTYYLADLVKRFSRNPYLALAGYNGGPNRVKRYLNNWYNDDLGAVDIDEFIESIPNRETRLYIQKVMGSYFEYKRLYDRKRG